ncbi:conserved hypothetical protein [Burkholderiales bacterium 8X]|nr:conserved hypothetical protein [Burkholderiales bacterium 8X]
MDVSDERIAQAIDTLLDQREAPKTICPSEVARALEPDDWRPLMPQVREVAVTMALAGELVVLQGGSEVALDAPLHGPIRLRRTSPSRGRSEHAGPDAYPSTPDGRYFVVRGRLWRKTRPDLADEVRDRWVKELMAARRALRGEQSASERQTARQQVDRAKRALGERGPAWWTDGAPDFNRKLAKNTPYAEWYSSLPT